MSTPSASSASASSAPSSSGPASEGPNRHPPAGLATQIALTPGVWHESNVTAVVMLEWVNAQ